MTRGVLTKTEHAVIWYQTKPKKTMEEHLEFGLKEKMTIDYSIPRDQADEDKVCKILGPELEW